MLTAAACVLSAAALGVVAATDGGTLMGWAAVLTALAAVIAALGTSIATSIATLRKTSQVASAVGPPNGKSLYDLANETKALVVEVKDFEAYQHERNHQVLNHLSTLTSAQPTLIRLIELLAERLAKEDP